MPISCFRKSDDFGRTWTQLIVNVNDDNDGRPASGSPDDVAADQVMVQLQVAQDGTIGLAWLDTRRYLAYHLLDVFCGDELAMAGRVSVRIFELPMNRSTPTSAGKT